MRASLPSLLVAVLAWLGPATGERPPSPRVESAVFSMYCYWSGEATVGRVEGVIRTRIGHLEGSEVVQVEYDPERTSAGVLETELRKQGGFYRKIAAGGGRPSFIASKHMRRHERRREG